jgi:diguanylate cyclase (GGDEF)-like protein/PAS domain S-box-containing protein
VPQDSQSHHQFSDSHQFSDGHQLLESLIINSSEIIVILDAEGVFQYVSPSAQRILGYTPQEAVGQHTQYFVHPDDLEQVIETLKSAIAHPGISQPEIAYRVRHRNQAWYLMEAVTTSLLHDPQVNGVVVSCRDITAYREVETRLQYQKHHDALTGLPNRLLLLDAIQECIEDFQHNPSHLFAVLLLDLDRFKLINSSFGHEVGDALLRTTAQRLRRCLKKTDVIARLGGDEFAIVLRAIGSPVNATLVTERIHQALQEPLTLEGHEVFTSASVGVALNVDPLTHHPYQHPQDLLRDADIAMYRAKASRKPRFVLFNSTMRDLAVERLSLETGLRRALDRGEVQTYYQPIVSLRTGRVTGFETLMRWQHPERGLVSPVEFIEVAEESGLIVALGQWVLRSACRQLRQWRSRWGSDLDLTLAVNLSGYQLAQPFCTEQMAQICHEEGIEPAAIELELTETTMMEQESTISAMLERLRQSGFSLGVDDFGTGYSSLSRLHHFPLGKLKIDRAFIMPIKSQVQDVAIARTIIALAHSLGMSVVAEGIETPTQVQVLRNLGCEFGQGYWFSPPVPAEQAAALIVRRFEFPEVRDLNL